MGRKKALKEHRVIGNMMSTDAGDYLPLYYHITALVMGKEEDGDVDCFVTSFCSVELTSC